MTGSLEQRTAALIQSHQVRLARAVVRQIQVLVPRYRAMDASIIEKNVLTLLGGVVVLLDKGDDRKLLGVVQPIVHIRSMGGFSTADFVLAVMCFFPVVRHFMLERMPAAEALPAYDALETVALPLVGRFVSLYEAASADNQPVRAGPINTPAPGSFFGNDQLFPLSVERVTGGDDEESTVRDQRRR